MHKLVVLSIVTSFVSLNVFAQDNVQNKQSLSSQLQEAMDAAVQNDYNIKKLEADIEISRKNSLNKKGSFLPEATYLATAENDNNFISHSITVNWNLFDGFESSLNLKIANAETDLQKLELANADRLLRNQIGKKYLDLLDLFIQSDIQKQEVDLRNISLKTMKQRFERGLVPESEVLKMNVDLLNSEISLHRIQEELKNELEDFQKVILYPVNTQKLAEIPSPANNLELNIDQLKSQLLKLSPLLKADQQKFKISEYQRKKAALQVFTPSLDAFYSYSNSDALSVGTSPYTYDSSTGLTLTWPLFSKLSDYSNYKINKYNELKADYDQKNTERDLLVRLQKSLTTLESFERTILLQVENEKLATRFYNQSLQRFRLGLISTNDMSLDQQRLTEARLRLSQLKKDYYKSVLDINFIVGNPIGINL